ncbi:hypothetical protein E4U55_008177 [Claviceps digitariae]|nr:hypothetical protein E4U55_008177 [Claviceps digitariae]
MHFFSLLLPLAAAALTSAAVPKLDKRLNLQMYCNGGTGGNGDCERMKFHTYCCSFTKHGPYKTPRTVVLAGVNSQNDGRCDNGGGDIYCA